MGLINEVISFAREYINKRAFRTSERKEKISEALRLLTGEKIHFGCSTCYIEALFKILNLTKMATPKGYELKKGVVLQAFGDASKTCTNITLTDELAEWYLKHYPEKAIYFARIPVHVPDPVIKIIPPVKEINTPPVQEFLVNDIAESLIKGATEPKKEVNKKGNKSSKAKK